MAYNLLSEPIRRYIRDKKWDELRPIQVAAITRITSTEDNYILASHTASGKTEAAFLPVLSKVNFTETGIQVLYISPLIALINDQFLRVESLCKYLDVVVTKWHGEANQTSKKNLLKKPEGVLLITPESLEAMLANHPENARLLFDNLKFVIIDEIHTFLGSDRGLHLKSLLSRISRLNKKKDPRIIGLSATIGDFNEAKRFTGKEAQTKVLLDKTTKEIEASFKYYRIDISEYPPLFIEELYEQIKDKKVLIFPNSRGNAEELAVKLKRTAERKKGHLFYFSHHSSVDKELREYIEEFAKNNKRNNFCIACTSTLELGIDIGSVDMVVQIDSAHSIASLIQRVGRSGRREGLKSNLLLYATNPWDLLQSFSCWTLYQSGFVEPVYNQLKPFDLLFHQTLSILKETCGISRAELKERLLANAAFFTIVNEEIEYLIQYMIEAEFIEDLKRELIVGYEGEKLTNSRDFYSMFSTPKVFKVIYAGKGIGEVDFSPQVFVDANIYLAAKIWKIKDVDHKAMKVMVIPANDGHKPIFSGGSGDVHPRVRVKMLELLYSNELPANTDEKVKDCLHELRQIFCPIAIEDLLYDRPYIAKQNGLAIYTFSGSKLNKTLAFILTRLEIKHKLNEAQSMIELEETIDVEELLSKIQYGLSQIEYSVDEILQTTPERFTLNKWSVFLPFNLQKKYVLENNFDVSGAVNFINNIRLVKETGEVAKELSLIFHDDTKLKTTHSPK